MSRACEKTIGRRIRISGAPARAQDATLQISGIGATLSERSCPRPQYLQPPAPSRLPVDASDLPIRSGCAMAQRDQRSMTTVRAPVFRLERLNLTVALTMFRVGEGMSGVAVGLAGLREQYEWSRICRLQAEGEVEEDERVDVERCKPQDIDENPHGNNDGLGDEKARRA